MWHFFFVVVDIATLTIAAAIILRLISASPRVAISVQLALFLFCYGCMTLTARDDYAFWIPPVLQLEFGAFYPIANIARNSISLLILLLVNNVFREGRRLGWWVWVLYITQVFFEEPLAYLISQ